MTETIKHQLQHRTIREFTDKPVPSEILQQLLDVAMHSASSTGMQSCSIIRITDANIKTSIAQVCKQEYAARAPELLIFIVDTYRNSKIIEEQNDKASGAHDMDRFFQGFTDAVIMAQNMTVAIESLNMGAVYFGSILNDSAKIIELLQLPKLTFPVLGLGFGYPNQNPSLKPRMKPSMRVFENHYKSLEPYLEKIADYDAEMQTYYDLRDTSRSLDSFSKQVIARFAANITPRQKIVNTIIAQGFDIMLDK